MVRLAIPLFAVLAVVVTIGTSGIAYAGTSISPDELVNYRVVTVQGYAVEAWLDENFPNVNYISAETAVEALQMMNDGRADVYLDPLATANYIARQNGLADLQSAGPLGDDYTLSIAYTEGDQTLGSIMQKLIDEIPADDRQALLERLANPPSFTAEEQAWLDDNPTITVAYDPSWPPYEYTDDTTGNLVGVSGAFTALFSALSGSEFLEADTIVSWSDALSRMEAGTADVMFVIENTAERDTYMDFTDVWLQIDIDLLVRDASLVDTVNVDNLENYRVVTVDGYAVETWLDANLPDVNYISATTALEALQMVNDGRADVYLDPLATANYLARQNNIADLQSAGPLGDDYALSIAYTEGDQVLGSIMQKLIDAISESEGRIIIDKVTDPPSFTAAEQAWLANNPTVTVAYDPFWAPYEYRDSLGHLAGLSGAYVSLFTALTGSDFAAAAVEDISSWSDALGLMRNGEADVMFVIENTAERDTYMDFTDPWMQIDIDILTLADPPVLVCR